VDRWAAGRPRGGEGCWESQPAAAPPGWPRGRESGWPDWPRSREHAHYNCQQRLSQPAVPSHVLGLVFRRRPKAPEGDRFRVSQQRENRARTGWRGSACRCFCGGEKLGRNRPGKNRSTSADHGCCAWCAVLGLGRPLSVAASSLFCCAKKKEGGLVRERGKEKKTTTALSPWGGATASGVGRSDGRHHQGQRPARGGGATTTSLERGGATRARLPGAQWENFNPMAHNSNTVTTQETKNGQ
jgi:hypothetical protein